MRKVFSSAKPTALDLHVGFATKRLKPQQEAVVIETIKTIVKEYSNMMAASFGVHLTFKGVTTVQGDARASALLGAPSLMIFRSLIDKALATFITDFRSAPGIKIMEELQADNQMKGKVMSLAREEFGCLIF